MANQTHYVARWHRTDNSWQIWNDDRFCIIGTESALVSEEDRYWNTNTHRTIAEYNVDPHLGYYPQAFSYRHPKDEANALARYFSRVDLPQITVPILKICNP